jgi:hypothetical protein
LLDTFDLEGFSPFCGVSALAFEANRGEDALGDEPGCRELLFANAKKAVIGCPRFPVVILVFLAITRNPVDGRKASRLFKQRRRQETVSRGQACFTLIEIQNQENNYQQLLQQGFKRL